MMPNILSGYELVFLIDVVLSLLAGFSIGAERESRGKDAGISTHSLVITGAMLFTFLSMRVDPSSQSRIAAQVVTGIGFLGAGLILKEGATVKNLTTAASIWFAGAIGMSFGFGYHVIGIIATVISGIIPRLAHLSRRNQRPKENKD
ncbi:putative Mg2+ transporter-C (MgtC) family protein [Fodinibius salinus]|uniref:Putative Mg2+ transporter-C (MgtC) family protein n=1 Tax=Fodinibius salinus TaxID=860790 RepID=A0A5D3YM71_9BACT|nr:MgtC/SapB family protein [Fodinibius salinus]TYP95246.1 putative Mg2+ transporter-C (MgtC) family protein [Fodinibius salinus]